MLKNEKSDAVFETEKASMEREDTFLKKDVFESTVEEIRSDLAAPTVSLSMIVKDEEAVLPRCLESVKDIVDEMVIVDTGSKDGTVEIAQSFGARVYRYTWEDNFCESRNFGLQFARGDWILQLDADEELEERDIFLIRKVIRSTEYNGHSFVILSDGPDHAVYRCRNTRLFRTGCVHYEGSVVDVPIVRGKVFLSPIRIYHYGYNLDPDVLTKKFKQSEKRLCRQIQEEPNNTYARANLVWNYRLQKEYIKMIEEAEKALTLSHIRIFDAQMIMNDLLYGYFITGNFKKAEKIGIQGLRDNSYHLDMLFVLGCVMVKQRRFKKAIDYFAEYLRVHGFEKQVPGLEDLVINTYGYRGRVWNNIGSCYEHLGKAEKALECYQKAIQYEETNVVFYKNLASLYLKKGKSALAIKVLENAQNMGIADDTTIRMIGKLKLLQPPEMVMWQGKME